MLFGGIDPGMTGALAIVDDKGIIIDVQTFIKGEPEKGKLLPNGARWAIEDPVVNSLHVRAAFTLGRAFETIVRRLEAGGVNRFDITECKPTAWQSFIKGDQDMKAKARVREFVERKYHRDDLEVFGFYGPRGAFKQDAADALCIALWMAFEYEQIAWS